MEFGTNDPTIAVWSGYLSPYHTMLAWLSLSSLFRLLMSTVHVSHPLSEVELGIIARGYTFQFEQ